MPSSMHTIL